VAQNHAGPGYKEYKLSREMPVWLLFTSRAMASSGYWQMVLWVVIFPSISAYATFKDLSM